MTVELPSIGTIYAVLVLFLTVPTVITCILCAIYHRLWGLGGIISEVAEAQHDISKLANLHTRAQKTRAAEKSVENQSKTPTAAEMRERAKAQPETNNDQNSEFTYAVR